MVNDIITHKIIVPWYDIVFNNDFLRAKIIAKRLDHKNSIFAIYIAIYVE